MNERVQKVLDGELPATALTAEERATLAAAEEVVDDTLAPLRAEVPPDLTDPVMREVRARHAARARTGDQEPGRWADALSRTLAWVWTPRPMAVRPVWVVATALAAVLVWAGQPGDTAAPVIPGSPTDAADPRAITASLADTGDRPVYVHFRLDMADAESVRLAGDFTDWQPRYDLSETAPGVWTVVVPVRPGVHEYAFVVDGSRWVADPMAPGLDDGFGGRNSRLDVVVPGQATL